MPLMFIVSEKKKNPPQSVLQLFFIDEFLFLVFRLILILVLNSLTQLKIKINIYFLLIYEMQKCE